jgi:hypothetical protein
MQTACALLLQKMIVNAMILQNLISVAGDVRLLAPAMDSIADFALGKQKNKSVTFSITSCSGAAC